MISIIEWKSVNQCKPSELQEVLVWVEDDTGDVRTNYSTSAMMIRGLWIKDNDTLRGTPVMWANFPCKRLEEK